MRLTVIIDQIAVEDQRYDTIGDWFYDDTGTLHIRTSSESRKGAFLIALHELVEAFLCEHNGVSQEMVDEFDFEHQFKEGEPGDLQDAPYKREHRFAMLIEHLMARELGMDNYGVVQ